MDKYVGKRLDGRYEIEEIIGVGGMAVVYKAYDNVENRTVAIKILKDEFVSNDEFIRRFKNESKAIAVLSHPNIVKVYDVSFGDLIQYIVMEYIDGITLKEYIEHQGSLRWTDAVHFTLQILKGLQHAHDKGIVHRDVKPQNIMVLRDGSIKVTDFGIARFSRSGQRTITDKAIGSVHYISPEQAKGERTDEKADVYSVGVMLYEMITGQLPFQAESAVSVAIMQLQRDPKLPTEINSSVPKGLEQITMHAMQKLPERRYQSAAEMLCDLEQFRKEPDTVFEYSYFVDNSPTKFVGGMGGNVPSSTPASEAPKYVYRQEEQKSEKSAVIPVLTGIAVALLAAVIIVGVIFLPKLFTSTGKEYKCPNFIGKTEAEAKSDKDADKFEIEIKREASDKYDAGIVFEQLPKPGKKLKKGEKITLTVSSGVNSVKIPNLYDKDLGYAKNELKRLGFTDIDERDEENDDVEAGRVIRTDPATGESVPEGSPIIIYVSSGKPVEYKPVPDLVKYEKSERVKVLEELGLVPKPNVRPLTSSDIFVKKGFVTSQKIAKGEKVPVGTEIEFDVSNGTVINDIKIDYDSSFFDAETFNVSLWVDGKKISESDVLDASVKSCVFKGVTFDCPESQIVNATVKVNAENDSKNYVKYQDVKIHTISGKVSVIKQYESVSTADDFEE